MKRTTKFIALALTTNIAIMPHKCQATDGLPPLPWVSLPKQDKLNKRFLSIVHATTFLGTTNGNFRTLVDQYPNLPLTPPLVADVDRATELSLQWESPGHQ